MYARFTTGQVQPGKIEEAIGIIQDAIVPAMTQQRGNRGATFTVDRQTGKVAAVSYWETEADMLGTNESSAYLKDVIAKITPLLAEPMTIENYEVSLLEGVREGTYIRLTTLQVQPAKVEEAVAIGREAAQVIREQPGNKAVVVLTDAKTGKVRVGTAWATEADRAAFQSSGVADELRSQLSGLVTEPPGPAEHFETVVRV